MWKRENILQELEQISSTVAGISRTNVYTTPHGYFDQFPTNIMRLVKGDRELHTSLPSKANQQVYAVPGDYFESLPGKILSAIKAKEKDTVWEELNAVSPLLASIPKHNVYQVPEGYFQTLTMSKPRAKAKVISFAKAVRYSVAAAIVSVMAVGGYLLLDNKSEQHTTASEINVPAAVQTLSENEIESYLQDHSTAMEGNATPFYIPDAGFDVKQVIKDLSDEELQEFLKENPAPTQGS
jgi:hypothetical protein